MWWMLGIGLPNLWGIADLHCWKVIHANIKGFGLTSLSGDSRGHMPSLLKNMNDSNGRFGDKKEWKLLSVMCGYMKGKTWNVLFLLLWSVCNVLFLLQISLNTEVSVGDIIFPQIVVAITILFLRLRVWQLFKGGNY